MEMVVTLGVHMLYAIMYVDDIMLMPVSIIKVLEMLHVVSAFGLKMGFKFNVKKSVCIVYGKNIKDKLGILILNNEHLEWVNELVYLGVKLVSEKVFCANTDVQRRKFFASINQVITQGKGLSEEILMRILKTQCVKMLVYGCKIWSDKVVELNKV